MENSWHTAIVHPAPVLEFVDTYYLEESDLELEQDEERHWDVLASDTAIIPHPYQATTTLKAA